MDVQPHLLNLSAYINQNLEKDLPLSSLAKRVGLSPFHFHRKFGAYFGESLHQHIKRLRLERAAFALVHGSAPVRQIARDSGYKTVSAFSHAFSGFSGESPTRYRSMATNSNGHAASRLEAAPLEPSWVGHSEPQEFLFIRAVASGHDIEPSVREAVEVITRLVGQTVPPAATGNGSDHASPLDYIAATSDVYAIVNGREFRMDVGLDASRVAPERSGSLGRQTLPGGRYARYDVQCAPDQLARECSRISLRDLEHRGETPRLSQYFVRFAVPTAAATARYQLFIPLVG
jgi:AraC-like DNA-binding protein